MFFPFYLSLNNSIITFTYKPYSPTFWWSSFSLNLFILYIFPPSHRYLESVWVIMLSATTYQPSFPPKHWCLPCWLWDHMDLTGIIYHKGRVCLWTLQLSWHPWRNSSVSLEMLDFLPVSNWFQFPLGMWSALIFLRSIGVHVSVLLLFGMTTSVGLCEDCVSPSSSSSPLPFCICELYGRNTIESFRKQGYDGFFLR